VVATAGDSTARALHPGLQALAAVRGWGYVQAAQGGCSLSPLLLPNSLEATGMASQRECVKHVAQIQAQVARQAKPDVWIVSDRVVVQNAPVLADGRVLPPGVARDARIAAALRATLRRLMASRSQIVVVGTPPSAEPADCARIDRPPWCDNPAHSTADRPTEHLEQLTRRVVRTLGPRVVYVSIDDVLCPRAGRCPAVVDGVLARYDGLHFSATFSRRVVPLIVARAQHAGISFSAR
jgi:hypothetical protein